MNILVLNGSPRKNGTVAQLLREQVQQRATDTDTIIWHDSSDLHVAVCTGCMACRSRGNCVLPKDDAHTVAEEIRTCGLMLVGTPVYWGNMSGTLKVLFDRLVYALMTESRLGIPLPLCRGKKAVVVTSCTTPFPFNVLCGQSSGAFRAVKEILKSAGFRIVYKRHRSGTKKTKEQT